MISVLAIVIGPDECDLDPVTTEGRGLHPDSFNSGDERRRVRGTMHTELHPAELICHPT